MRWNSLGRSLGFALVSAAAAPVLWHLAGHGGGAVLVWIALSSLYVAGLAPGRGLGRRSRALAAALAVAVAGGLAALLGLGAGGAVLATTAAIGFARAAWLHRGGGLGRWAVEIAVGTGSLALAGFLWHGVPGGPVAFAAAVWGYWLVQGLVFLTDEAPAPAAAPERDGFEQARRRLVELLDEGV